MKTKSFLMIFCLFAGTALMSLNGQKSMNKSVSHWETADYFTYVVCDGYLVDIVTGVVKVHAVTHFKDGEMVWEISQFKGDVVGESGEVFKMKELDKEYAETNSVTWRYHLKGNEGSHYIGTLTLNMTTWRITVGKTVCH
jgi:hypothetical protein